VILPPAKTLALIWQVSIDTVYDRRCGRIHTTAKAIDDLSAATGLSREGLVREFARRRRRYEDRQRQKGAQR
jgi:hypothetical protein